MRLARFGQPRCPDGWHVSSLKNYSARRGLKHRIRSQRQWLRERNFCGCNEGCRIASYIDRINLFRAIFCPAFEPTSSSTYNYACVSLRRKKRFAVKVVERLDRDGRFGSGTIMLMAKDYVELGDNYRLARGEVEQLPVVRVSDKCT